MSDRDAAGTAPSGLGVVGADMPANQLRARLTSRLGSFRNYGLIFGLALIWIAFDIRTNGIFLSQRNLGNLGVQTAITGIAAVSAVTPAISFSASAARGASILQDAPPLPFKVFPSCLRSIVASNDTYLCAVVNAAFVEI